METTHIPIKTEFNSKGFAYKQLVREGDLAIYEQKSIKYGHIAYEVVRIRRHNGYKIAGQSFPPAEMYPSNTQWGRIAWTCNKWEDAEKKFAWAKKEFEGAPDEEVVDPVGEAEHSPESLENLEIPKPAEEAPAKRKPGRPRIHAHPEVGQTTDKNGQTFFTEILNPGKKP